MNKRDRVSHRSIYSGVSQVSAARENNKSSARLSRCLVILLLYLVRGVKVLRCWQTPPTDAMWWRIQFFFFFNFRTIHLACVIVQLLRGAVQLIDC